MPSTLFDSAGLAIVAYAQVDGATGQSEGTTSLANSGVNTTRTSTGMYYVTLPTRTRPGPVAGPDLRPAEGHHRTADGWCPAVPTSFEVDAASSK